MSNIRASFQSSAGKGAAGGSGKGLKSFNTENGIIVLYEVLSEIIIHDNKKSDISNSDVNTHTIIDTIFIVLCMPDTDYHKISTLIFEPTLTQIKQAINYKPSITPENILKNVQKCQPQLEVMLSENLDGIPRSGGQQN